MGRIYKFSDSDINDMVNMYKELETIYKIAEKYGVDFSVIKKRLSDNGVVVSKGSPYSVKHWLNRGLSEDKAKEYIKTLRPVNKEYWIKLGYSEEESILQIEGQKLVSLRGCVARFGVVEGEKIWYKREKKRSIAGKKGSAGLEYWVKKGYSLEEAKIKRSQRQSTFSKEICIEKYGEEEGLKKFTERQIKWCDSLNKNGNLKIGYSKISQELFNEILKHYDNKGGVFFATHNKEFRLYKELGGVWLYDFTDIKNKKIIEYNGDQYHGNPKKYSAKDYPHPFRKDMTAQEMWCKDERKLAVAKEESFEVLVIWDSEYRWGNKEEIVKKCVNFLFN